MSKLKNIMMIVLGAISAFFYVLLQSKNRKIKKQQDEINQHKRKNEEFSFINQKEQESKNEKDHLNILPESDIDSLLEQNNAHRD
ncbi:MAG: hypothetical protein ACRCXK_02060 [Wohlfahrtiimonas sp.]